MNYIYFTFIIFIIALLSANFMIKKMPFYSSLLISKKSRNGELDGFRGILALGVFIYHSNITYFYYKDYIWSGSHSHFLSILGNGSVIFFFIITGFLFWEMILKKNGIPNIRYFIFQRIKRLVPMFLVSLILIFIIAFIQSEYSYKEIITNFYNKILFFLHIHSENISVTGIKNLSVINAGVYWTLVYEWKFYIILPILSLFFVNIFKMWKFFPFIVFIIFIIFLNDNIWLLFILGMISSTIKHKFNFNFENKIFIFFVIILTVGLFFFEKAFSIGWYIVAFLIFSIIFSLNLKYFSFLNFSALRMLGVMSYSIYLLHGIVLWVSFQVLNSFIDISSISIELFFSVMCLLTIILILICALSFQFVENRFHHY